MKAVRNVAKRLAAKKSEELKCKVGALKVLGLAALDATGNPSSPAAQTCPHLSNLLTLVRTRLIRPLMR